MLPAIGFIIATYTIFRYVETMGKPDTKGFITFLAVVAILVTLFLCSDLWRASSAMPSLPGYR